MAGDTHALSAHKEVAALEFAKDLQELFEEPGDLRCQLVVVADVWFTLRKAGLQNVGKHATARIQQLNVNIPQQVVRPRVRSRGWSS